MPTERQYDYLKGLTIGFALSAVLLGTLRNRDSSFTGRIPGELKDKAAQDRVFTPQEYRTALGTAVPSLCNKMARASSGSSRGDDFDRARDQCLTEASDALDLDLPVENVPR